MPPQAICRPDNLTPDTEYKRWKILMFESGSYEDYRQSYFYAPVDFSWSRLAEELEKRKRLLNPNRVKVLQGEEVMELALKALGCEPVRPHFSVNIDYLCITYEENDKVSYVQANAFIASMKDIR